MTPNVDKNQSIEANPQITEIVGLAKNALKLLIYTLYVPNAQ